MTGGTGFVGGRVARALVGRGARVRVLARVESPRGHLDDLPVEFVDGDVRDLDSVRRAVRGCRFVFHVAALYKLWSPAPSEFYDINVRGTMNVLTAARDAGVERIVHTSSVATLATTHDGTPKTESDVARLSGCVGHYKKSKWLAEQVALRFAECGVPVVVVNPSAPVGAADVKPTPTGRIIVDFLNDRMPAYVDTGLNVIDVDDVAAGHLLAAERGRVGERYILGNRNMTLREILETIAGVVHRHAPRFRLPSSIAMGLGVVSELVSKLTGRPPMVPLDGVRMARKRMYFDASKAVRELGLPQTPPEQAFRKAVDWFTTHGYVSKGRAA